MEGRHILKSVINPREEKMKKNYRKVLSLILVVVCVFSMNLSVLADESAGNGGQDAQAGVSAEATQTEKSADEDTADKQDADDPNETADAEAAEDVIPAEEVAPDTEAADEASPIEAADTQDADTNAEVSANAEDNTQAEAADVPEIAGTAKLAAAAETADAEDKVLLSAPSSVTVYYVQSADTLESIQGIVDTQTGTGETLHFAAGIYAYDGTLNIGAHNITIETAAGANVTFTPTAENHGITVGGSGTITFAGEGSVTVNGENSTSGAYRGINCGGNFNMNGGVLTVKNTSGYGIGGDAQGIDFNMTGGTMNITHCGCNSDEGGFIWDNSKCNFIAGKLNVTDSGYSNFGSFYVQCPVTFGSNEKGAAAMTVNLSNNASGTVKNTIVINNTMTVNKSAVINATLTGNKEDTAERRGINTENASVIIDGGKFIVTNNYKGSGNTYGIRGANVDVKNGGVLDVSGTKYGVAARGIVGTLTSEDDALITLSGAVSDSSETKNTITGGSVKMDDNSSVVKGVMTTAEKDLVDVQPVNASGELLTRFDLAATDDNKSISISANSSDPAGHMAYTYQVSQNHDGTEYVWAPAVSVTFWNSKSDIKADGTGALGKDYTIRGKTLSYVDGSAPSAPAAPTGKTFSGWMISEGTADSSLYDAATTAVTKNIDVYPQYTDSPVTPTDPVKWQVSKSKTASPTALSGDSKTTTVTLSLPSAEEEIASDVVFVMDSSSCGKDSLVKLQSMSKDLLDSINTSNAKINVGIVVFRATAKEAYPLTVYDGNMNKITAALTEALAELNAPNASHGSNLPSGLDMAQKMLNASGTPKYRQHMILISDGKTYLYTHNDDPTTCFSRTSGKGTEDGSLYEWKEKYPNVTGEDVNCTFPESFKNNGDVTDWTNFLASIASVRSQYINSDQVYSRIGDDGAANLKVPDPLPDINTFIINVEESMYQSADVFGKLSKDGVNCYAVNVDTEDEGVYTSFMKYLGNTLGKGTSNDFSNIQRSILYLINSGTVTDTIGSDFDLVTNGTECPFTLTLAGTALTPAKTAENEWSFGTQNTNKVYPYIITYTPGSDEKFTWKINVPVKNAESLQLSYKLLLTASPSVTTTYPTNKSAELAYTSSDGSKKGTETFEVPKVIYTPPVPVPDGWQVSKSKKASPTALSGDNKTTTVTLSLPSAEEELSSDVVFVMDDSSCINTVIKESMAELLQKLYSSIGSSKAKINVGIVMFRGNALTAYKLTEYKGQEDNSKILDAVKNGAAQLYSSTALHGSNIPSGLEAAKEMLQASSTPNNRKYMVLIGDGGTYLYMKDSDPTTCYSRTSGIGNNDGSIAEWNSKYGSATTYPLPSSFKNGGNKSDWDTFISSIQAVREQFTKYDQKYVRTGEHTTAGLTVPTPPITDISTFITNVEESMYQTTSIFKEISESGVNCYAVYAPEKYNNGTEADMGVFKSFVQYLGSSLGKGTSTDFSNIEKEIVYLLNKGTVTDVIGSDFNLVMKGENSPFTLTLAGTVLDSQKTGDNEWSFGTQDANGVYPYVITCTPGSDKTDASFVWKINVPVENAKPLQLSYDLTLKASSCVKGTYPTNKSATLDYTSSTGSTGKEDFEIPYVTYTASPTSSSTTSSAPTTSSTTSSTPTSSSTTSSTVSSVPTTSSTSSTVSACSSASTSSTASTVSASTTSSAVITATTVTSTTTTSSSSPKTGDDSPLIALMIALFASGFTILLLTDRKRSAGKRRKN